MKKIIAMVLALIVLGTVFAACGEQPQTPDSTQSADAPAAGYRVSVVDPLGNPYTEGIIVRFMQNGQQVSMQTVGADGVAAKDLPDGEYTVELKYTDAEARYYYDAANAKLTTENKSVQIQLSKALGDEPDQSLYANGQDAGAYAVSEGCTYVKLTAGQRSYFLFTPTQAGKYQFSMADGAGTVGYYGAPHFVQDAHAGEYNEDGSFFVNVKADMIGTGNTGTTVLVLGIDGTAENGILAIQRVGDPDWTVEDEPWHTYTATIDLQPYTHDAAAKLGEFDLTAASDAYTLVLGSDNYYHLNTADGPLVLVRLGKNSGGSKYLADFQTILEHSGINKYFFDENGEFIKKETYDQCLLSYFEVMDEASGLYPLTEDLKYIIQMRGDHAGWFDSDSAMYLFVDQNRDKIPGINGDIAWLFICCYAE